MSGQYDQLQRVREIEVFRADGAPMGSAEPVSKTTVCGNVVTVMHHFRRAGDAGHQHVHAYDHQTLLASGKIHCVVDGVHHDYVSPCVIIVPKGKKHFFEAKADNTVLFCIHALRGEDGEVIDPDDPPQRVAKLTGEPK